MIPHHRHDTRTVEQRRAYYRDRHALQREIKRREAEPTWWLDTAHFYELAHARDVERRSRHEVANYMRRDVA